MATLLAFSPYHPCQRFAKPQSGRNCVSSCRCLGFCTLGVHQLYRPAVSNRRQERPAKRLLFLYLRVPGVYHQGQGQFVMGRRRRVHTGTGPCCEPTPTSPHTQGILTLLTHVTRTGRGMQIDEALLSRGRRLYRVSVL